MRGILAGLAFWLMAGPLLALDSAAKAAIVIDHNTGSVLLSKNAEAPLPPASMSKLMTLYMAFEAIRDGRLSLDDRFPVSAAAQAMGGSTMFLDTTDRVRVEDLILGIIVQSGNDACVVLAEGLAGSERVFAERMTARGQEIGLRESTFVNSTGWPHPNHRMSLRDLATVATRLIDDFPEYYAYFALEEFDFDGRAPANRFNRNPILGIGIGADGLKTGHTQEAGYGLVGSAKQGDRRVTIVVSGLESTRARRVETERLITWAFREFAAEPMFEAGETVTRADVWLGDAGSVPLVSARPVVAMVPTSGGGTVTARVAYRGPIEAPIAAGATVAELIVDVPGLGETRFPLQAGEAVARGGFFSRVDASATLLAGQVYRAARGLFE